MTTFQLKSETHEALADAIRILVDNMGPRQRRDVARLLAEQAGEYDGSASLLLVRLAQYVQPD